MIQQIAFILVSVGALGFAGWQFAKIRRNILFGQAEKLTLNPAQSWRNVLLVAFGQQKMFKNWIPAVFHFFIYAAFVITQIELIEILLDGFAGVHRFFAPLLKGFYTFIISFIEILSLLAFVATVIFLIRRNVLKIKRFEKPEMRGWPQRDANIILLLEIVLLVGIFSMNGADTLLQSIDPQHYPNTGKLAVSSWLGPALFGGMSESALQTTERFGWWLHILTVFAFLNYLPVSKHLHILLAFPNTYFAKQNSRGEMDNMPEIMHEVKSMMGLVEETNGEDSEELPEFGANDVFSLSWKNLLDAYSCTECGRCTAACPANLTGKKLSPRKIVMDIRDRAEEIGRNIDSGKETCKKDPALPLTKENYDDGKSLFDYISREELHACTTCNACVEACPVLINPMEPILKMRRYEILTESAGPAEWVPLFNSIENGGSAWAMSVDRDAWTRDA
ncbi:MAG TPA: (Fe-S)-binding protein [Saprospiraceae bacterium]|nr:(Fe-S)-binding protein [Saprospiraceae bacterium]HMP23261.1 (Fe-S)-binding protein [Saprospiraceae bacterium]